MLTLTRNDGQKTILYVGDTRIVIGVRQDSRGNIKLDFDAPLTVRIVREEIDENFAKSR